MSLYEYSDGGTVFEGYLAINKNQKIKKPCVMIAHAWDGLNDHFCSLANNFAKQNFVGFAIDVYGKDKRGKIDGNNMHLMNPLIEDRSLLRKRLLAAFNEMQKHPLVLPDKIAIIGYCFGGLCALDLARANPSGLKGAISIHGGLTSSEFFQPQAKINASILVLHGLEDPVVPQETVLSFIDEMTKAEADFQIHCYGHAKHAFTFVGADIPEFGVKYNEKAHYRSETSIKNFIEEVFK